VLMDVQMPVMDGNEATRRLRQDMGLKDLPVIALTAGALVAERQRALDSGMDDFISKPLDPHALIRLLRRHVESRQGTPWPVERRQADAAATPPHWPRLPDIDTREAAERIGPDPAVFLRMLERLLQEYQDLRQAPTAESPRNATLAARLHKLRGSAGMLSAKVVQQLAGDAEALARSGGPEASLRPALEALAQALGRLNQQAAPPLAALRKADGQAPAAPASAPVLTPPILQAWLDLLEAQDLGALARFRELAPALRQQLAPDTFAALQDAVERLSFGQAAAIAIQLRAGLAP